MVSNDPSGHLLELLTRDYTAEQFAAMRCTAGSLEDALGSFGSTRLYRCRHDNSLLAIALYHRAAGAVEAVGTEGLLGDRARLLVKLGWRDRYGFEIV